MAKGAGVEGWVPELKDKRMHLFLKDEIMIAGYSGQYCFFVELITRNNLKRSKTERRE